MFQFVPAQIPRTIIVIGAGGTGARLIPMLTQFIASIELGRAPRGWVPSPRIVVVDADGVEPKNLVRQNFCEMDIGRPKAVVVAERYERAYGTKVIPIQKYVTADQNPFEEYNRTITDAASMLRWENSMVILAVDSNAARKEILANINRTSYSLNTVPFIIDAGNEDDFGQVKFGHAASINTTIERDRALQARAALSDLPPLRTAKVTLSTIPLDVRHYMNLGENEHQASCEDLPQTLAINAMMAVQIMAVIQNFYYRKPMSYTQVSMSLSSASILTPMTFEWLKGLYEDGMSARDYGLNHLMPSIGVEAGPLLSRYRREQWKSWDACSNTTANAVKYGSIHSLDPLNPVPPVAARYSGVEEDVDDWEAVDDDNEEDGDA